jgi:outer membrane protein OmpA-like peptidoglycan-associated protein
MRTIVVYALAAALLAGCRGGSRPSAAASPQTSTETSAASSAAASPGAEGSQEPAPLPSAATPTPQPTPTPDANLLSWKNGAIVRAYPAAMGDSPNVNDVAEHGPFIAGTPAPPFVFVYELPGPADITAFTANLPAAQPSSAPATVTFATSNTGPTGDFKDAGTIAAIPAGGIQQMHVSVTARWIRVTASAVFYEVGAAGSLAPLPSGVSPAGIYVEMNAQPYASGGYDPTATGSSPWYRRFSIVGNGMTATRCFDGHYGDGYPGTIDGRVWTYKSAGAAGHAVVNDDASMIVGDANGSPMFLMHTTKRPKFCEPFETGTGAHRALVLDSSVAPSLFPIDELAFKNYSYERMGAGMLAPEALAGKELVVLNGLCDASNYLSKGQTDALLAWVSAGHKLLIVDSDSCSKSQYDFVPYAFTTSNPGAQGASGDRLIIVENDALGTGDKSDFAHFFNPQTFINNRNNQLGDANIVTTQDAHWCGHLFGTNVKKDNGFMQMYAPYGQGIIIYDGFDHDDGSNPGYQRVRGLEFALSVPVAMPCTQSVALAFLIQPNQERTFVSGTSSTIRVPMEALANQGWSGHVDLKTTGDFPATVTPAAFDMAGGTRPLNVVVSVPSSAKSGAYTVNVTGTSPDGKTAQASITIAGTAPLKKAVLEKHQRIRIYGIHFDVDSAHIQPRSEPVIAQIAALMKRNPSWRLEISGHTDSDGGAAYNLRLSQQRAQSVVNDLVARYGIASSRMIARGYGLTRPVATNATEAGKALNRRVELERLQ